MHDSCLYIPNTMETNSSTYPSKKEVKDALAAIKMLMPNHIEYYDWGTIKGVDYVQVICTSTNHRTVVIETIVGLLPAVACHGGGYIPLVS